MLFEIDLDEKLFDELFKFAIMFFQLELTLFND